MTAIEFVDQVLESGIKEVVGVPCSYLKHLIDEFTERGLYTPMNNEGDCVAYAAGREMSGDKVLILIQNSGITNALSPLSSLIYPYKLPIRLVIGMRGGDQDEPQHQIMPSLCGDIFDRLDIKAFGINELSEINKSDRYAICIGKNGISPGRTFTKTTPNLTDRITPENAILEIVSNLTDDDIIVASTGFNSRRLLKMFPERVNNFYMVGSMGCAPMVGAGFAMSNPDRRVVVIDGDGSLLMRPNSSMTASSLGLKNLRIYVLDNQGYESTGDQPVLHDSMARKFVDFIDDDNPDPLFIQIVSVGSGDNKDLPRVDDFESRVRNLSNSIKED